MNEEIREDLLKRNEKIWEMPMGAAAEVVRAEGKLLGNYYGVSLARNPDSLQAIRLI